MTVCAGICQYNGKAAGAVIHLSFPLLSLRTRRDLIDILLHEMIHAFLYTVDGHKEREEHGPKFCKIMDRINARAGTHVTIFYTFDEEVENLKKHWWRCTGNCKKLPQMFGLVERSMNRPPGPSEPWWNDHRNACAGKFIKVKELSPKAKLTAKRRILSASSSNTKSQELARPRIKSTPNSSRNKENSKPKSAKGRKKGQSDNCPCPKAKSSRSTQGQAFESSCIRSN